MLNVTQPNTADRKNAALHYINQVLLELNLAYDMLLYTLI